MDLWRIVVRVVFAYIWVLVMVRVIGRRAVHQSDVRNFVVALVIGDMFDDLFWAEVAASTFIVGVGTLIIAHLSATLARAGAASRTWRRSMTGHRG
jgi:uncharacterized membrane protein YcaP (DUF421 family)